MVEAGPKANANELMAIESLPTEPNFDRLQHQAPAYNMAGFELKKKVNNLTRNLLSDTDLLIPESWIGRSVPVTRGADFRPKTEMEPNESNRLCFKQRAKKGSVVEGFSIRHEVAEPLSGGLNEIRTKTELTNKRKQENVTIF